jgi:hypothetical protein
VFLDESVSHCLCGSRDWDRCSGKELHSIEFLFYLILRKIESKAIDHFHCGII